VVTILYYAKVIRGIVYSADNRRDTPSREFTAVALDSAEHGEERVVKRCRSSAIMDA